MENFFDYFKDKLSLTNDHLYQLRNIILNDNTTLIKQNFNIFYENKTHILNEENFFIVVYFYIVSIFIANSKKLLSIISSKLISYQETNKYITNFLGYIDFDSLSTNDVNELKYKILLINNLYDVTMKFFDINNKDKNNKKNNNDKNNDKDNKDKENVKINLLNKFFGYFINSFEKKNFHYY